jgi:putative transposase
MTLNRVPAADATCGQCPCGCFTRRRKYCTDLTDRQWAVLEPLLPPPACLTATGGRPEKHCRRAVVDAIFYLADNGTKWRNLPDDFPPWRTVYGVLRRWRANRVLHDLVDDLRAVIRRAAGRREKASAGIIDAQSVHESAEGVVPAATSGYDQHKNVNGRKRHLLVDTLGLLIAVAVSAASVPDRDGAVILLLAAGNRGTRPARIWADHGYAGAAWIAWALQKLGTVITIVEQPRGQKGFTVLPRRWVVERTHAWITRRRRCARDYERLPSQHEAMVQVAAIIQMTRRAAKITRATAEV